MEKLNATLESGELASRKGIARLIRQQLLRYPLLDLPAKAAGDEWIQAHLEHAVESKTSDMCKLFESLRSVHKNAAEWKLEEDNGSLMRVLYRRGPDGTPFHTYCVEGIVNGPFCPALCVLWEVPFFKDWWPQMALPAFKVLESKCLKRLRVCESLFLTRFKVPWPLTTRELVVTTFLLELLQEGMIFGNLKTVPLDNSLLELEAQGFDGTHVPKSSKDVVRMEANGGFVLQRLSSKHCYLRAVMDLDLKLDMVAPWIINFIGRQLVGHCFKLYHKTVLSVEKNPSFVQAMARDALYRRVGAAASVEEDVIPT